MRQYSDRKNSLNDNQFFCGNSLTNCFSKKVSRSTKSCCYKAEKLVIAYMLYPQFAVCRNVTQEVLLKVSQLTTPKEISCVDVAIKVLGRICDTRNLNDDKLLQKGLYGLP